MRRSKKYETLRFLQREGLISSKVAEEARPAIITKQRGLELTERNNYKTANNFAARYRSKDGQWASQKIMEDFADKCRRLGYLRKRINTIRQIRGLPEQKFSQVKY